MEPPTTSAIERPPLAPCHAHANVKQHLPDFLIISPPKTGSTWLASNLQCHPEVFLARMKEVKYFSMYHRWLDLDWYAGHFRQAGARLKGEASPSYALLPCGMIRWIHSLMPRVKLLFLMRDPVARAWSHARHNYRYREANFENFRGDLESVPEGIWRENFRHPWPLASGDYLGQLRRWLSVFPGEQIHVDLYERLSTDPEALLLRALAFLGVRTESLDWPVFRTREIILPGVDKTLPAPLARDLQGLLRERTRQLETFLRDAFSLDVRESWENTLDHVPVDEDPARKVFARAMDDVYLADLLDAEVHSSDPQLLVEGYHGYNLVLHRGRFVALAQSLGDVNLERLHEIVLRGRDGPGILLADSMGHIKERVAEQVVQDLEQRLALQLSELQARQRQCDALLSQHEALIARLRSSPILRVEDKLRPWLARVRTFLGRALGRLRPRDATPSVPGARLDPILPQKPP